MRRIIVALSMLMSVNLLGADMNLWKSSTLYKVMQKGELRVGMDPGYMPFEMRDKQGKIIGIDIDLAKLMAKEMGVKLTIVPTAFDGILGAIAADKFDIIISGITVTQKRNLKVNFSNPYMSIGQTLLVTKKHANKSWSDLNKKGIVIVTKIGVTGEIVAKKRFKNAKIKTFDTEADAVQELINGKADAFIYDKPYNYLFMLQKGKKSNLVHLDQESTYEPIGFAIRKGDPDFLNWLNNFLIQIKGDGRYELLYNKWFKDSTWLKRVM